jgi:hypothetical protein
MKRFVFHISFGLIIAVLGTSCEGNLLTECLSGRGNPSSEKRGLYPFGNIAVHDNIDLILEQGADYSITINTGHKLIPLITNMIHNNTLEIRNESPCGILKDPWKRVEVIVRFPKLDSLFVLSNGDVGVRGTISLSRLFAEVSENPGNINLNLNCEFFRLDFLKGTADVSLTGYSDTVFIFNNSAGKVDALNVRTQAMVVNSNSSNHVYVRSGDQLLDVKIEYIGNVYYTHDPLKLILNASNSGRLFRYYQ